RPPSTGWSRPRWTCCSSTACSTRGPRSRARTTGRPPRRSWRSARPCSGGGEAPGPVGDVGATGEAVSAEGGAFRSLRVPTLRRFLTAQLVMMCGTWMQGVAQSWLVLDVSTDDAFAVGVIAALGALPVLLFGAWGGVLVDRFAKRAVLLAGQSML